MAGYRINERNTGDWTLDGEPKRRRKAKSTKLEYAEMIMIKSLLNLALSNLEYDEVLSEGKGRLNPDAVLALQDAVYCCKRSQIEYLHRALEKIENLAEAELKKINL